MQKWHLHLFHNPGYIFPQWLHTCAVLQSTCYLANQRKTRFVVTKIGNDMNAGSVWQVGRSALSPLAFFCFFMLLSPASGKDGRKIKADRRKMNADRIAVTTEAINLGTLVLANAWFLYVSLVVRKARNIVSQNWP